MVARMAHNHQVVGSNPSPATIPRVTHLPLQKKGTILNVEQSIMKSAIFLLVFCASSCANAVPNFPANCDIDTRPAGINFLVFFACDWTFSGNVTGIGPVGAITDVTQWTLGVDNNKIGLSPEGFGEKPLSTFTNERISACLPEAIVSEIHQVNFTSKAMDNTNLTDCTFWNTIRNDYNRYRVGWIGCDGFYYGLGATEPGFRLSIQAAGSVVENNNDTAQRYEFNFSFNHSGIVCPQNVPNLMDAFASDAGS